MCSIRVLPLDKVEGAVTDALTKTELKHFNIARFLEFYRDVTSDPDKACIFIGGPSIIALIMDSCLDRYVGVEQESVIGGKIVRAIVASVVEVNRVEAINGVERQLLRFRRHRR